MNYRQKKKRDKKHSLIIICRSHMSRRQEDYERVRKDIERQLKTGSVLLLPAGVGLEAVIKRSGSSSIKILEVGQKSVLKREGVENG